MMATPWTVCAGRTPLPKVGGSRCSDLLVPARRRHCRQQRGLPTAVAAAAHSTEQLTQVAARLSTVRCRELLAACYVELLKAALVGSSNAGSAAAASEEGAAATGGDEQPTPEAFLDSLHASLQAILQDAAHTIAPEHHEAWGESGWEAFQAAHGAAHHLLLELHQQAAKGGSGNGSLQMARCLEHGLLVPQDAGAAFRRYRQAAAAGSAEAALRCGIHYFEGTAPGGRDGAQAFDFLSQALEFAEAQVAGNSSNPLDGTAGNRLPSLAAPSPETAVEGDLPPLLTAADVRFSALTWLGRCYLEGAGVERSVALAANHFRQAGNSAELAELVSMRQQFAEANLEAA